MSTWFANRWTLLVAGNVLFCGVLSFYQTTEAAPPPPPFAPAANQRYDMIAELREIKALLQEQNNLLRTGRLQVIVVDK